MTDDLVVVLGVAVLSIILGTIYPVFVAPRLVRAWESAPAFIRSLGGFLLPFAAPVLVLTWTEIDKAITRRVQKTGTLEDDLMWADIREKVNSVINRYIS